MNPAVDLPARQALDRSLIDGTVTSERRDERGANTGKWGTHGDLRQAGLKARRYKLPTSKHPAC
jgi:hypothetical protein